jgi:hypothetical protein
MRFPWRWLDRVWLCLVALAFLIGVPIWIALWYERHPLLGLIQAGFVGYAMWSSLTGSSASASATTR